VALNFYRQGADMDKPLENFRHERFCQLYAGALFGNGTQAYIEAGYRPKEADTASAQASMLLRKGKVWARIQYLREISMNELDIDRRRILEMRLEIAKDSQAGRADRLKALDALEKSLGLEAATKVELSGKVEVQAAVKFERG
jgi:phage terminase small subunit